MHFSFGVAIQPTNDQIYKTSKASSRVHNQLEPKVRRIIQVEYLPEGAMFRCGVPILKPTEAYSPSLNLIAKQDTKERQGMKN